jgi:hypothetical protein
MTLAECRKFIEKRVEVLNHMAQCGGGTLHPARHSKRYRGGA